MKMKKRKNKNSVQSDTSLSVNTEMKRAALIITLLYSVLLAAVTILLILKAKYVPAKVVNLLEKLGLIVESLWDTFLLGL
jgi:hypothetical protein